MSGILEGANVLVTGGTGSLGRAFVASALRGQFGTPERVLVFSRDEAKQHHMRTHFIEGRAATDDVIYQDSARRLRFRIGDVRSLSDVSRAIDGIDMVIHAAALKQVPSCEYFPEQAIETNCRGATNIIEAIRTTPNAVRTVVGLSTDKACAPTNVMGMTKALQERLLIAANLMSNDTKFVTVRYGNIVASRGSVIPLFLEQIRQNKPLTLTSENMTRFLMPIAAAVETIIAAVSNALPGEIVVRAAPSIRIRHLIEALAGNRDVPVKIIGLRPGEKLHEMLITQEEAQRAIRIGPFCFVPPMLPELGTQRPTGAGEPLGTAMTSDIDILSYEDTAKLVAGWNVAAMAADAY